MASRVSSAMGGGKKSKSKSKKSKKSASKHVHKMHLRRSSNGGYIAEHEFNDGSPNEEHTVGSLDELKDHVGDNMQEEEPVPGTPMSMPQAGPPRGGM